MSEGTRARGRLTPAPFAIPRDGGSIPPISTTWPLQVAVQGRAVVTVVSRWPASVVAVVLLVSISPRHRVRCAKKFALRARNTPNLTFLRLLGEFCRGLSGGGAVPGEFCRVCRPCHRPRNSPWPDTTPAVPPSPEQFLARHYPGPAAAHRHRGLARRHSNFACNSPAAYSNIEFASLELQRFLGLLNFGPIELHAKFVWLGSCCRLSNFARNSPAACSNIEFASLGLQRFRVVSKSDRAKLCAKFFWRWPCEPVLALPTGRLHRALAFRPPDPPDPSGPSGSFGALHAGGAWCVVLAHSISASRSVQNSPCSASWW